MTGGCTGAGAWGWGLGAAGVRFTVGAMLGLSQPECCCCGAGWGAALEARDGAGRVWVFRVQC